MLILRGNKHSHIPSHSHWQRVKIRTHNLLNRTRSYNLAILPERKTCLNKKMNNLAYDYYGIQFTTRSEIQTSTDELHLVIIYFIWIENNSFLSTKRECTKKLIIIIHFHFHFYKCERVS